jgi:transcriptional regulator GlxA family with amidase domain
MRSWSDPARVKRITPPARTLAAHVGVTDRTLLRAFHETYGVPPKRYLMSRQFGELPSETLRRTQG